MNIPIVYLSAANICIFASKTITMIDVRQAALAANDYLKGFYPEASNIKLEEVELFEDEEVWSITLSYDSNDRFSVNFNRQREYKIFRLNSTDGRVLSMKIRELQ